MKPHRLPTLDDVLAACHWRLAGLDAERIAQAIDAAVPALAGPGDLATDAPALAPALDLLRIPGDRRSPWSALCAALALHAQVKGDAALFWRCGLEALGCARLAGRRTGCKREPDQLDQLLAAQLARHPSATARQLWDHCARLAEPWDPVIAQVQADVLTYVPSAASERLHDLTRQAFDSRVSAIRSRITKN